MHINEGKRKKNLFVYNPHLILVSKEFFCWMKITFTLLVGYNRKVLLCCYMLLGNRCCFEIDNNHNIFDSFVFLVFVVDFAIWNLIIYQLPRRIDTPQNNYNLWAICFESNFYDKRGSLKNNDKNKIIKGRNNGKLRSYTIKAIIFSCKHFWM